MTEQKRRRLPHAPDVTVAVTASIIQESTQADSSHCMIAEAVKLAFPGAGRPSVDVQTIRFSDPKKRLRYYYLTPRSAQNALVQYDAGMLPEPFVFRLRAGSVVAMASRKKAEPVPRSEKQKEAQARTGEALQELQKPATRRPRVKPEERATALERAAAGPAQLRQSHSGPGTVPIRTGGQAPPLIPHARRRQFGLRAMERVPSPEEQAELLRHTEGFRGEFSPSAKKAPKK